MSEIHTDKHLKDIHCALNDGWQLFKKYYEILKHEDKWHDLMAEAEAIYERYGQDKTIRALVFGFISMLEEEGKEVGT